MSSGRQSQGQVLAVLGALGLAASLWLPWYTVDIPQSALDAAAQAAKNFGALGPLVTSGARLLSDLGPFHVTAWQVFHSLPAVLLAMAVIGGGLALLALSGQAGNAPQVTMLAGLLGAVLVGYHIAVAPGQGSFIHPTWGIYVALLSALAMLAGGALIGGARPESLPVLQPVGPLASGAGPAMSNITPISAPELPGQAGSSSWSNTDSVPPPAA